MNDVEPHEPGSNWLPPQGPGTPPTPFDTASTPVLARPPAPTPPPPLASSAYGPVSFVPVGSIAGGYPTGLAAPQTDQRNPGTAVVVIAWIITVITIGYMLPWAIAATRGRSNQAAIGLISFLLGWTFVGWIVALVMACQAHQVVRPGSHVAVMAVNVSQPATTPAGWYSAPSGHGQRYWDGHVWTDHHAP